MSQLSSASRSLAATATLLLLLATAAAAAAATAEDAAGAACKEDINALWSTCKQFVQKEGPKLNPSPECCAAVKAAEADASCICEYLGSADAKKTLSLEKVFYVTEQCGVTVPSCCGGSKQV